MGNKCHRCLSCTNSIHIGSDESDSANPSMNDPIQYLDYLPDHFDIEDNLQMQNYIVENSDANYSKSEGIIIINYR